MSLPDALLTRLRKDEKDSNDLLTAGSLPDAVQKVKESAERKLLSITNKAVDTLEEVMDYGAPKDRVVAARKILETSPATKNMQQSIGPETAIPLAAFKGMLEGMAKLFSLQLPAEPKSVAAETKLVPNRKGKLNAK
jgi:hypothetical protein